MENIRKNVIIILFDHLIIKCIHEKKSTLSLFDDNLNNEDLCEILDLVDNIHNKFLTEPMPSNEDIINDFRQLTFELIDQKSKIVKEDN